MQMRGEKARTPTHACNEHAARLICARQRSERVPQHVHIIPVSLINIRSLRIFLPFYLILSFSSCIILNYVSTVVCEYLCFFASGWKHVINACSWMFVKTVDNLKFVFMYNIQWRRKNIIFKIVILLNQR